MFPYPQEPSDVAFSLAQGNLRNLQRSGRRPIRHPGNFERVVADPCMRRYMDFYRDI